MYLTLQAAWKDRKAWVKANHPIPTSMFSGPTTSQSLGVKLSTEIWSGNRRIVDWDEAPNWLMEWTHEF